MAQVEPVYLDLHIHTSDNPDVLNAGYDVTALHERVTSEAQGSPALISLTDHNAINKRAYLASAKVFENLLLGAELHVRNFEKAPPYHCHVLFRAPVDADTIDAINAVLDELYPAKTVGDADDLPTIETIAKHFDEYDFMLLPHGGQNHSTFNKSIPKGKRFDSTIERSIYYNHFDGFTARSNRGLDESQEYFKKLGILEFVNLITSTDNYSPRLYPQAKSSQADPFVPTWMLASPTFNGLRLSLSESARLVYGKRPDAWAEYIRHVSLKADNLDIDCDLTPGLNVVIGGSSSGKTLLVDSLVRKISGDFKDSVYIPYGVEAIDVTNPSGQTPHYLWQNYIVRVCDQKDHDNTIDSIPLLKSVFPGDADERELIDNGLANLSIHLQSMVHAAAQVEQYEEELRHIPVLSGLITTRPIRRNPLKKLRPFENEIKAFKLSQAAHERAVKALETIEGILAANPFIQHDPTLTARLTEELAEAYRAAQLEEAVRAILNEHVEEIDAQQKANDLETTTKRNSFGALLRTIRRYRESHKTFYEARDEIASFKIRKSTKRISSMGHTLYIENEFELTQTKFLEVLNQTLKRERQIPSFDAITPQSLASEGFKKQSPKIVDHDNLHREIMNRFNALNRKQYRITTKDGKDFDKLSAGWKTSVILDLVLGSGADNAPLIIDQPEDNLATTYINTGLLSAIKQSKATRQIILVSHNATIPMLGDAQNVILCTNDDKFITIRSNPLEGVIDGTDVVDLIATTTDGGKASIKKRVKKYNLKRFRGEDEAGL